jgi:hypothetical protein
MGPVAHPKVMKNALGSETTLHIQVALSFVIPKRSRGICSSADLSWKCFRPSVAERSAVFFFASG